MVARSRSPATRARALQRVDPRVRRPAHETELTALYSRPSPLEEESPYHAFARCPPSPLFGTPDQWPGPRGDATSARLLWNEDALYVCWELEGSAAAALLPCQVESACLAALEGGQVQSDQRTVLLDERVECFLWQRPAGLNGSAPEAAQGEVYCAFEINYAGKALTLRPQFSGPKNFGWNSDGSYEVWTQEMAVGLGITASPVPSAVEGMSPPFKRIVIAKFRWEPLQIDSSREIRIGLHRAQHAKGTGPRSTAEQPLGQTEVDRLLGNMVWSSCIDPGDAVVNFHRPDFFARLVLAPDGSSIDCSCRAVRMVKPRTIRFLSSPMPSLAECPPGAVLVRGKYASICGSDAPYFKSQEFKAPSCYWDRDGFCGHEVVGVIVESKSDHFELGDHVMALPSSYFKAHASAKPEWFRDEVHSVLLQPFVVRGGFCQIYTSHELYCYKIKECIPRMLAAQALGTLLKMARQLGPVLGKTVVIVGQGQNGLIATRLMSQFCARSIIAVEPLEYRRSLALRFGADQAVTPEQAQEAIHAATDGRGADVVLEMVGHNQVSINNALRYARNAGTVIAFGVPDDRIYALEFSELFRKNISLTASVFPDPGVDFPDAVRLIETGRFSTDGIFTHTLPLCDIEKVFDIASNYKDGVVKLVVDLS